MLGQTTRTHVTARRLTTMVTSLVATLLLATFLTGCGGAHVSATPSSDIPTAAPEGALEETGESTTVSPALEPCTLERVVDGDTIVVDVDGESKKVRLIGIDAAESVHPDESRNTEAGVEASDYLKSLITPGQTLYLQRDVSETDRYGRLLRYVWIGQPADVDDTEEVAAKMLNAVIVENGYAQGKDYAPDTRYSRILHSL